MKKYLISMLCIVVLTGCGSVAPLEKMKNSDWKKYNHKTTYAVKNIDEKTAYLTVKYSSYTFLDKSTEMLPTAKMVFAKIAYQIAQERKFIDVIFDQSKFYESTAYNGITGVSTTLVSNDISLLSVKKHQPKEIFGNDSSLSNRLLQLKEAYDKGLITSDEYKKAKAEALTSSLN